MSPDIAECSLDPANMRRQFVIVARIVPHDSHRSRKVSSHAKRQLQSIDHGSGPRDRLIA
jgi:hypothetical protein